MNIYTTALITEEELKQAISDYVQKQSERKYELDTSKKIIYLNGTSEEKPLFTHIEITCKIK